MSETRETLIARLEAEAQDRANWAGGEDALVRLFREAAAQVATLTAEVEQWRCNSRENCLIAEAAAQDAERFKARAAAAEARVTALEAAQAEVCGSPKCACGHFHCEHRGAYRRGVQVCDVGDCECKGFHEASGVALASSESATADEPRKEG